MKIISVSSFPDKKSLLQNFSPQSGTWIVSDLQSKWELQRQFLETHAVLDENAILRASELWTKILFRLEPATQVVSRELLDQWIWSWLKDNPNSWSRVADSASSLRAHLEFFAPIFSDENSEELVDKWFENNPDSVIRWRHVFEVCKRLWHDLEVHKIVTVSLIPSRLLAFDFEPTIWDSSLTFDMGPRTSTIEKKLAERLSKGKTVFWIEPDFEFEGFELKGELHRLPTQLGEVKDAVAQVRMWLDQGVSPQKIGIFAPDIEKFWPAFHHFLKMEGIPVQKPLLQKLVDDPKIQAWLARLRIEIGNFSKEDLESYYFQETEFKTAKEQPLSDEEFRHYFSTLADPESAQRWPKWKHGIFSNDSKVHLLQFMEWAIEHWPSHFGQETLDRAWKVLAKDHFEIFKMSFKEWLAYVERKLAKAEQVLEDEFKNGVHLFSFPSGEWVEVSHMITLGLSEQDLKRPSELIVSPFEAERLKQDLGFDVECARQDVLEAHLGWLTTKPFQAQVHLSSGVNILGEDITPSKYWLKSAFQKDPEGVKHVRAPRSTRFDQMMSSFALAPHIDENQMHLAQIPGFSVSASSLKAFNECAFIFFAQKGLKLVDQPVLDFDLDPMTKGQLMHAVFERLITEGLDVDRTRPQLEQLVDHVRAENKTEIGDERIWPAMRNDLIQLAGRFVEMERDWRKKLPELKTIGQEVPFSFEYEGVKVTGRIDRMDQDASGRVAVVDYKSSNSHLKGWRAWRENGDFQMVLYTLAIEQGNNDLKIQAPVIAAYYHVPKTKERQRGFFVKEEAPTLFADLSPRSQSFLEAPAKEKLIEDSLKDIQQNLEQMKAGVFFPNPKDHTLCEYCRWRGLCRAPHLI